MRLPPISPRRLREVSLPCPSRCAASCATLGCSDTAKPRCCRSAALFARQIDVARGHCEAIAFPDGFRTDHLDAKVEIACHPRHDPQLLKVLFAEDREIRTDLREQFADHGRDTSEKMRAEAILQADRRRALRRNPRRKTLRIHGLDVGIPDQIDILGGEFAEIGLPGTRIGAEIFRWRELGGVDKDRNDYLLRAPLRQRYQRHMPVMECTHGWHQRDRSLSRAKSVDGATQRWNRADDRGAW